MNTRHDPEHAANASGGMSRRDLMRIGGAGVLLGPLIVKSVLFGPRLFAQEAEATATSALTSSLMSGAASSLAGDLASYAVGQLIASTGVTGQDQTVSLLESIIAKLDQLQKEIEELDRDLGIEISQTKYDTIAQPANVLMAQNYSLMERYRKLAKARSAPDRDDAREEFRKGLAKVDLEASMNLWHRTLHGSNGSTGLIEAWSQLVFSKTKLFGLKSSKVIQKNWEHFDAEQSRTLMFLVEHLNDNPKTRRDIPAQVATWQANRALQLKKLRGMVSSIDTAYGLDSNLAPKRIDTNLKTLPQGVAITTANSLMWCLKIGRVNPRRDWPADFHGDILRDRLLPNVSGCPGAGQDDCPPKLKPFGEWWVRNPAEVKALLDAIQATPEHYLAKMQAAGFVFPPLDPEWRPGDMNLWLVPCVFDSYVSVSSDRENRLDHKPYYRGILSENRGFDCSNHAGDHAMLLFARDLAQNEENNYWYRPAS